MAKNKITISGLEHLITDHIEVEEENNVVIVPKANWELIVAIIRRLKLEISND